MHPARQTSAVRLAAIMTVLVSAVWIAVPISAQVQSQRMGADSDPGKPPYAGHSTNFPKAAPISSTVFASNAVIRWSESGTTPIMMTGFRWWAFRDEAPNEEVSFERPVIDRSVYEGFGTAEEAARRFLVQFSSILGIPDVARDMDLVWKRDSRAAGRRMLFRPANTADSSNPASSDVARSWLVGVNRPLHGESRYTDSTGQPVPKGFVQIISHEKTDLNARRSDWYVYFVSAEGGRTIEPERVPTPALAAQLPAKLSAQSPQRPAPPVPSAGMDNISNAGALFRPIQTPRSRCSDDSYSFTGTGRVFPGSPGSSTLTTLPLRHLCTDLPVTLEGALVSVSPLAGSRVSDTKGVFEPDPDSASFDEVSVYYHLTNFMDFLFDSGLDPSIAENWRVQVTTSAGNGITALAAYRQRKLLFGRPGYPYRSAATEAAVVAHETMHLIMFDHFSPSYLGVGQKESWAMGEAYPDYFGLAYRAAQLGHRKTWLNPVIGDWYVLETTRNTPRDLSSPVPNYAGLNTANYVGNGAGDSFANLYDNSVIFSSALMDFDREDDSDYSISYVLESLNNIASGPTFIRGRDALMQAVNECVQTAPDTYQCCESGLCGKTVQLVFGIRGIGVPDIATATEPDTGELPTGIGIEAFPNPFSDRVRLNYSIPESGRVQIGVFDGVGRRLVDLSPGFISAGTHHIDWTPESPANGIYFLRIETAGRSSSKTLFVVR